MRKAIGIDLGGTSILGGIISEDGNILKKTEIETGKAVGYQEVLRRISFVIQELVKDYDEEIVGVGIGSPGFIDTDEGKVLSVGGNIQGWAGVNIRKELSDKIKYPIYIENDANVAGLCEGWIGAGMNMDSFVMFTIGTGLGGAIFTNKEGIWHGHNYQGSELGHAILYPNGIKCTCGQKGCVEQYISGTAIENSYKELTGQFKKGKDIFQDEKAISIINKFAMDLAIFIVTIKNILDPEGIIIGGGVINSKEIWWDKMIEYYESYVNDSVHLKIVPAIYLNDSGMIGAGKLAFDKIR